MKKRVSKTLALTLVLVMALIASVPASAGQLRASSELASCTRAIYADGDGKVTVEFTTVAVGVADEVGATQIVIQRKVGSGWVTAQTFTLLLNLGNFATGADFTYQDIKIYERENAAESLLYDNVYYSEISLDAQVFDNDTLAELENAYVEFLEYAAEMNVPVYITLDDYINSYSIELYGDVSSYEIAFESLLAPLPTVGMGTQSSSSSSSGGSSAWYYNTGQTLPSNATPVYDSDLYTSVQKGDIVYEANGGFGITGHAAIVEGKYHNSARDIRYIRIIEAIDIGVVRSVLDDTRVSDKEAYIYRVNNATATNINNAVSFCSGELGSTYFIDFAKDTSSSETDLYCSELVWAAYKNQNIDIECAGNGEPGVTPRDITLYSSEVTLIYSGD
jgi:hypothetical protein